MSDELVREEPDATKTAQREAMMRALLERFGPDFVGLVEHMGLVNEVHIDELLHAPPDEQPRLAMAWLNAATRLEADWTAQSRRPGAAQVSLARYLEIRLPSPREAQRAEQAKQSQQLAQLKQAPRERPAAQPSAEPPPTPRERESARRRLRMERAIAEARAAMLRIDALDLLEEPDRQAIVTQLEDILSLISRRLRSAIPGREPD